MLLTLLFVTACSNTDNTSFENTASGTQSNESEVTDNVSSETTISSVDTNKSDSESTIRIADFLTENDWFCTEDLTPLIDYCRQKQTLSPLYP